MAEYTIECDICLGLTHWGAVETSGKGTIELSDEEVNTLVDLVRKKQSTNPDELGLEESHPDLYEKLDDAYSELYYQTEETYWLKEGIGHYEYDLDELQEYCAENCGYNEEEDDFDSWLDDYIDSLPYDELCDFFYNHLNADVDMDASDVKYEVHIPKEIIEMAKEPDTDNA